ncbi:unnamed protein product [Cladocopium goreaui]|uniref:Uncharacterized protein n=1 Tax=Cladocopium goreaui TaxID=2562237 RepID=A0A9P1DD65_9DINO|nr:unnamed protein product [Cladocopium goreaui]
MLMVIWSLIWGLATTFWCCSGNSFAVPSNVELRERILAEKVALRDELRSHTWFARSSNFNRYLMLVELSFYLADIILDFQMFWLYQDRQHYWFAAAQGFIILRTIDLALKHLKRIVCSSWLLSDGILSGRISEQMLSCHFCRAKKLAKLSFQCFFKSTACFT